MPGKQKSGPIVLLATDGVSTRAVYHALTENFGDIPVILEERVSRFRIARRRARKLGLGVVLGQIFFQILVVPLLKKVGERRIAAIKQNYHLDDAPIEGKVIRIPSVNSNEAREVLQNLDPAVVVVNGTRIIGHQTLQAVSAPFINTHAGITPLYRGTHGGYWALAEGHPELAGTTVHLVDEGIDTGQIIAQATFSISPEDSFATYPYLHIAVGIPILLDALRKVQNGKLNTKNSSVAFASRLRHHPTIWQYCKIRISQGVR